MSFLVNNGYQRHGYRKKNKRVFNGWVCIYALFVPFRQTTEKKRKIIYLKNITKHIEDNCVEPCDGNCPVDSKLCAKHWWPGCDQIVGSNNYYQHLVV